MMSDKNPYRPSNGSEGEAFMALWCFQCENEWYSQDEACNIMGNALAFDMDDPNYPKEWVYGEDGKPTCTNFSCSKKCQEEYRCEKTIDIFEEERKS